MTSPTHHSSSEKSLLYPHAALYFTAKPQVLSQPPLEQTITMSTNANQEFSNANTATNDDLPEGSDTTDDSYASRLDKTPVPVIPDETSVEQPNDAKNPNSKETLGMFPSQPPIPAHSRQRHGAVLSELCARTR